MPDAASDPSYSPTPPYQRVLALLALAAILALVASTDALHARLLDLLSQAEAIIRTQPLLGIVIFVAFAAASAMLAFVSSAVIVPIGVLVWGRTTALLLLWLGWILGGLCSYLLSRYLGRPLITALNLDAALRRYERYLSPRTPFPFVLLFQAALPSELPGYLLGLARYPLLKYALALMLAELPYAVATVFLGSSFLERRMVSLILAALLIAAFSAWSLRTLRHRL